VTVHVLCMALLCGAGSRPLGAAGPAPTERPRALVLDGGTLIDVSHFGRSEADIRDARVVIRGGAIVAAGPRKDVGIPPGARFVDVRGRFIVPGLIDGFASLGSQAQANAYLYMGVTSIIGLGEDDRRPPLFRSAKPGPRIYRLEDVGIE